MLFIYFVEKSKHEQKPKEKGKITQKRLTKL
jgi:hypothetical protein